MSSPNIERFRVFLTECFTAAAKEVFVEVEHLVKECYEENERLRGMLRMFVSSDTTESTRGFYQFTGVTGNIKELLPTAITLSDQDTSEPLPKRLKEEQVEVDVNCRPEAGYVQVQVKTEDIVPSVSVQEDSQVEAKRTYCIIDASQLPKESNTDDDSNETLSDMDNNESNVCHSSDSEAEENTIGTKRKEGSTGGRASKKRRAITMELKVDILKRNKKGGTPTGIGRALGLSRSTVATIIKDKHRILEYVKASASMKSTIITKQRSGLMIEMERLLVLWLDEQTRRRIPLSLLLIREKAKRLFETLKKQRGKSSSHENFAASRGWFMGFKARANLKSLKLQGETASANSDAASEFPDT